MACGSYYSCVLSLLACLLTLAQSGDDINLARLMLPSAFSGTPWGTFPTDDENNDFTRPTESEALPGDGSARPHPSAWADPHPAMASAGPAPLPSPFETAFLRGSPRCRALLSVPLRC
ncbi:MAG TPA: hypothetical protein VG013_31085 [Gemmataceae bacterium]|jgi:hypothetical protein|nr:hypothetical protein [Gemmataceae bacterium]